MTVAFPGDLPQVLTVGAALEGSEGVGLAAGSASGPTVDGRLKPELVAPAADTAAAAAIVGGVAALLLEAEPWLTPDEVKLRLLAGARERAVPILK